MIKTKSLKTLALVFILFYVGTFLIIAFGNEYALLNWFSNDDAFYYFKVAQNIGEGAGSSFDGINLTNGYHPLWMLICIPVFTLARFDLLLPLRLVIVISSLFYAGASILLFKLLDRIFNQKIALVGAAFWAFSSVIKRAFLMGGLESSINAFFMILLWERILAYNAGAHQNKTLLKKIMILGGIAALAVFSRLDNIFLVFFAGVWVWLKWWQESGTDQQTSNKMKWLWRIKTGFAYYGPIAITVLLYMGWNQLVFDTPQPVSGQIKIWWGDLTYTVYGDAPKYLSDYLTDFFSNDRNAPWYLVTPWLHNFGESVLAWFGQDPANLMVKRFLFILGGIGAVITGFIYPQKNHFNKKVITFGLIPFFLGCLAQIIYYQAAGSVGQRQWYWVGEYIFVVLFFCLLVSVLLKYFEKHSNFEVISKGLTFAIGIYLVIVHLLFIHSNSYPDQPDDTHPYNVQNAVIRSLIDPGTVIGLTGSGRTGYLLDEYTVVNLDGLVNSYEYFQALKSYMAVYYLTDIGLEYVIGSEPVVLHSSPYKQNFKDHLELMPGEIPGRTPRYIWRLKTTTP